MGVNLQTEPRAAGMLCRSPLQGSDMTKGKHGNKEAKKPKQVPVAKLPTEGMGLTPVNNAKPLPRKK